MRQAGRYHALRAATAAVLLVVATFTGLAIRDQVEEKQEATHAAELVQRLLVSETAQVPGIVSEMAEYRKWTDPLLREENATAADKSRQKLHTSLALLPVDPGQFAYLSGRLLNGEPQEVAVIRDALAPHKDALLDKLWAVVEKPEKGKKSQQLRAALGLATYEPESDKWAKASGPVVDLLVAENPAFLSLWVERFRPIQGKLMAPLVDVFRDTKRREGERISAAKVLADYTAGQQFADLFMDADEKQLAVMYPKLKEQGERDLLFFAGEVHKELLPVTTDWTVQFHKWENGRQKKPPADWEAVLKSPILDELRMSRLNFYGKTNSPTPKIPRDYFAVVATTEVTLGDGQYVLTITSDDGVRVWLDKEVVIEDWTSHAATTKSVVVGNKGGRHIIKVEYFQIDSYYILDVGLSIHDESREQLAKRQANAAVALLTMARPEVAWQLLKHGPDPTLRSYLMERLGPGGVDPNILTTRLDEEKDVSVKRALILSLGGFSLDHLSQSQRLNLVPRLLQLYQDEPDPGIHGAAEWLLRQWGRQASLKVIDDKLRANERQIDAVWRAQLTKEQKQRLGKLTSEIENTQSQLTDCEKTLSLRQVAWGQKLREQHPASLQEGLIAHYPLDESIGSETINTVNDQPGGKYRGTGKPEWVPGVMGRALRLNGNGEIVGGSLQDLESNNAFSYGCWFQSEGQPAMILMSNRDGKNGFRGFDLSIEPGYVLRMEIVGEDPRSPKTDQKAYWVAGARQFYSQLYISVATATTVLSARQVGWHHVLVTYDGSKKARGVQIYVDGKPQPLRILRDSLAGTIKSDVGIHLGSRYGTYRFRGLLDDVRIYNRCFLAKEVSQLYAMTLRIGTDEGAPERQLLRTNTFRALEELRQHLTNQLTTINKSLWEVVRDWWIRRWYINQQGQTMVVISRPDEFWMGEGKERHRQRIGRSFAIASKHVTVGQFLRFRKEHHYAKDGAPTHDCPVNLVTWYDAAAYCNWLSEQEGIAREQWCYEPNQDGKYAEGMKMAANYLQRTGYRLPTEAEWEFSCRAGSEASYSMGVSAALLDKYGWFDENSLRKTHPVGALKSNDLGLFDMHGNDWEWCQNAYKAYGSGEDGKAIEDIEDNTDITNTTLRVQRGGSVANDPSGTRSARRFYNPPTTSAYCFGFRPARTLLLGSFTAFPPTPEGGRK